MLDFNAYMKDANKEKHCYMTNKYKEFLAQILEVPYYQTVSLDSRIKKTETTVRKIVTNIRDFKDGKKLCHTVF